MEEANHPIGLPKKREYLNIKILQVTGSSRRKNQYNQGCGYCILKNTRRLNSCVCEKMLFHTVEMVNMLMESLDMYKKCVNSILLYD